MRIYPVIHQDRHFPTNPSNQFFRTKLLSRRWLSEKTFEIELSRPAGFEFTAGQTILLKLEGLERHYSLVSGPQESSLLLCVRFVNNGVVSVNLSSAKIGTKFDFTGPHGYFTFKPSQRPPIFVATGTGIAPFAAMAKSGVRAYRLLHGASQATDLYYQKLFRSTSEKYVPCISGVLEEDNEIEACFRGLVTDYLKQKVAPAAYDFYLCGRQDMVTDVMHLVDERFPNSLVYYEVFYRPE